MSIGKKLWVMSFIVVLLIGCNRDGRLAFKSGVPSEKEVSQLSVQERKLFCESYKTYTLQLLSHESICTYLGVAYAVKLKPDDAAGRPEECSKAKKECLREELKPECPYKDPDFATCRVTVKTAEKCIDESIKKGNDIYAGLSCDGARSFNSEEALFAHLKSKLYAESSPVCEEVKSRCGGFARQDF